MYAKIAYNADAGNNAEQVLHNLDLLLTGTTLLSSLTGNVDLGSSTFSNTWQAVSWTLYDTIALSAKIYELNSHDDITAKVYVEIFTFSTDELHMRLWEAWDQPSNTGSNGTYYFASNSPQKIFDCSDFLNTPFIMYVSAVPLRHMMIRSEYGAGLRLYFRGFVQWDRGEAWDTIAAGFRPFAMTYNDTFATSIINTLPHKRSDNSIYTLLNSQLYLATRYGNSQLDDFNLTLGNSSANARGLNATSDSVHNMYEIGASHTSSGERFMTGKFDSMYLATYQNGAFGDIVTISAVNYRIWETDLNYRIAIRDG